MFAGLMKEGCCLGSFSDTCFSGARGCYTEAWFSMLGARSAEEVHVFASLMQEGCCLVLCRRSVLRDFWFPRGLGLLKVDMFCCLDRISKWWAIYYFLEDGSPMFFVVMVLWFMISILLSISNFEPSAEVLIGWNPLGTSTIRIRCPRYNSLTTEETKLWVYFEGYLLCGMISLIPGYIVWMHYNSANALFLTRKVFKIVSTLFYSCWLIPRTFEGKGDMLNQGNELGCVAAGFLVSLDSLLCLLVGK